MKKENNYVLGTWVIEDCVCWMINKVSSSIKSYFKITKKTIGEMNESLLNINNDSLFNKCVINDISMNDSISKIESLLERIESILKKRKYW